MKKPRAALPRPIVALPQRWSGRLVSVQPRIRRTRSYDEKSERYLGFVLRVQGQRAGQVQDVEFGVAISKVTQNKYQFRRGDLVSGLAFAVVDVHLETVEMEDASELEVLERESGADLESGPPWHGIAPPPLMYRNRGHRRLDPGRYAESCRGCMWGCELAVTLVVDPWGPDDRQYRRETECYGPLSCKLYEAGPPREVPGRKGKVWEEPDSVDEDSVSRRGPDD